MNNVLSQVEFTKNSQLGIWTSLIEYLILLLILIGAIWIIKKQKQQLISFILINLVVCILFFAIGYLAAIIFKVTHGNLVQQLIGPCFILLILVVYHVITLLRGRKIVEN
ncbi:hypothetical protein ACLIA0_13050 [Bacillaceae bacterium W0354]